LGWVRHLLFGLIGAVGWFGRFGVGEQGHGFFGEVAAVADLPFVVDLAEDRTGEPEQRGGVGEDTDDVGASFDLPVDTFD
jgi:hypothetical protein